MIDLPSRQINEFSQKGNRKKIELVARPGVTGPGPGVVVGRERVLPVAHHRLQGLHPHQAQLLGGEGRHSVHQGHGSHVIAGHKWQAWSTCNQMSLSYTHLPFFHKRNGPGVARDAEPINGIKENLQNVWDYREKYLDQF